MIKTPAVPVQPQRTTAESIFFKGTEEKFTCSGYMIVKNIISGTAKMIYDNTEITLYPGDTFIFNPHDEAYIVASADEDCHHYSFTIDQVRHFDSLCVPALTRFKKYIKNDVRISEICKKIGEEYANRPPYHENMLIALTNELLIHLFRNYNTESTEEPSSLILGKHKIARLAVDYIYANSVNGITTSEISKHINVSISYLCRCFKESTGVSVLEFAERIRCRKAREDLSLGIYTVTQIAEKYNFNSLSYFSRRYKKYCGENPFDTLSEAKKRRS